MGVEVAGARDGAVMGIMVVMVRVRVGVVRKRRCGGNGEVVIVIFIIATTTANSGGRRVQK